MGKSLRNKAKTAARRQKRTDSHYAVHEAERLARLSAKLTGKQPATEEDAEEEEEIAENEEATEAADVSMAVDAAEEKKISTSGNRDSRRETWRVSKGMTRRPERKGINRQGMAKARTKSGRPGRRR